MYESRQIQPLNLAMICFGVGFFWGGAGVCHRYMHIHMALNVMNHNNLANNFHSPEKGITYLFFFSAKYVCHVCGKQNRSNQGMVDHMKREHGTPNFNCAHCQKHFISRTLYRSHLLNHSKVLYMGNNIL
jgi:DNA-directed RNA polymerase subunit RPC12/RpoP